MHHSLDYSPDPHQALREVERVLIPEGRLIIMGFNPWSLFGLMRLFSVGSGKPPWSGFLFPTRRINDWLSLLGFDLVSVEYLFYRPPIQNQTFMQRLLFLEQLGRKAWPRGGSVYIIEAVKRSATLTPIKPKWRIGEKVLPAAVEPTTRSSS
jgi:SAM-dependent methyltransferase